jgi:hypothetical protein
MQLQLCKIGLGQGLLILDSKKKKFQRVKYFWGKQEKVYLEIFGQPLFINKSAQREMPKMN